MLDYLENEGLSYLECSMLQTKGLGEVATIDSAMIGVGDNQ